MSVAPFIDFKRTGRGSSSRPGREVGEKGVTSNALLREARADRELPIIFEGHRSAQNTLPQRMMLTKKDP